MIRMANLPVKKNLKWNQRRRITGLQSGMKRNWNVPYVKKLVVPLKVDNFCQQYFQFRTCVVKTLMSHLKKKHDTNLGLVCLNLFITVSNLDMINFTLVFNMCWHIVEKCSSGITAFSSSPTILISRICVSPNGINNEWINGMNL